ncbi:Sec1-like protein [Ochromonadaceae sp. CCMP2298]|nr:Sec1-like protein [Ochromonadaceae sp. CCMP2298]
MASAVSGAQNVYTQHQPVLFHTLDALAKGRIKDATFPPIIPGGGSPTARPSEVVVFMVGGATYEEATRVAEFNAANPAIRVILGGSCVHNSTSFLKEIGVSFAAR